MNTRLPPLIPQDSCFRSHSKLYTPCLKANVNRAYQESKRSLGKLVCLLSEEGLVAFWLHQMGSLDPAWLVTSTMMCIWTGLRYAIL